MRKRILTIVLAVTSITLISLGAIYEARAELGIYDEEPYKCNNFDFRLESIESDSGNLNYNYVIISDALNISKMSYFSLGINGNFGLTMSSDGEPVQYFLFEPGAGNSDGWLEGVPQLQTISSTPQTNAELTPFTISVSGVQVNEGLIAAYTKAGNKIEKCFIYGPVLEPLSLPIDVTVPKTKQVALNDDEGNITEYCINIDPRTGCPYPDAVPYECDNPGNELSIDQQFVLGSNNPTDPEGPVFPTMLMGEGDDPRCPVVKAAHNPCQWVILSGRPYGPICW